jgi:hypothetical protein
VGELTLSARSSSANLPVPSTLTRAPKILILSVSIADRQLNTGFQRNGELTGVGNENLGVLYSFWGICSNGLVENETYMSAIACL